MGWELHSAKSEFSRFAEDWDRLNKKLYNGHPFFDSRFVGALLDHFATGDELLCLYREQNDISAGLILQPSGCGRWKSFRPSQAQITAVLVDDALLLSNLFKSLPGLVWIIDLIAVDPRYAPNFMRAEMETIVSAQAYTIGVHSDIRFADYWNLRSKNLKASIRRRLNRMKEEFGSPILVNITHREEMKSGIGRFGALESSGWKGAAGTAISDDNIQGAFYSDVMQRFASTGQAYIYELLVANRMAASQLAIASQRMTVLLKTTYDEPLSNIAPGRVLLHHVIEDRLTNYPGQTIEFYTNANRDQKDWATIDCTIQNIQVFRNDFISKGFSVLKAFQNILRSTTARREMPEGITIGACPDIGSLQATEMDLDVFSTGESVEKTLDWYDLLQKTVYPEDSGVRFYHASVGNRLTTILPLRLARHGSVKTVEALSNFYTSLYSPLQTSACDGLVLRHLLSSAAGDHGGAHVMRFAPMDTSSPAYAQLLNELRAIGWITFDFRCFGNWFLEVKDNWEGYLRNRSANLRSTIKRKSRDFSAAGGTLQVVTGLKEIEQGIDAFQEVYSASWKVPEPYPDFIPSLIRQLATKGLLRLGIARLQGKPVAAQLWIVAGMKASIFKLAYHETYANYSPGTVLTSHLLNHVIEQDHVREVDFLRGDDKYKRIWMSDRRERRGIVAYNPTTVIGFALLIREIIGRITKAARHKSQG